MLCIRNLARLRRNFKRSIWDFKITPNGTHVRIRFLSNRFHPDDHKISINRNKRGETRQYLFLLHTGRGSFLCNSIVFLETTVIQSNGSYIQSEKLSPVIERIEEKNKRVFPRGRVIYEPVNEVKPTTLKPYPRGNYSPHECHLSRRLWHYYEWMGHRLYQSPFRWTASNFRSRGEIRGWEFCPRIL